MKATELRIGNFIHAIGFDQIFCLVSEIRRDGSICFFGLTGDFHCLESNEIEPIPLTEEWLLKLGFELEGLVHFKRWSKGRFKGYLNPNDIFGLIGYEERHLNIKYVHQLQNLYFALTGEELDFNPITQP